MNAREVLRETEIRGLGRLRVGKVRDVYEQKDRIILITTDRHSSFDRIIAHIPHKGQVLNQMSAWWCERVRDIVPSHVIAVPDPNATVAEKCSPFPVEAVVRGYLTGVTDTAIWKRYQMGERRFGSIRLPGGMPKNRRLPEPVFDPTTKEVGHDRSVSQKQMIAEGLISRKCLERLRDISLALFARGQRIAAERGYILADTKYEFGLDRGGVLRLIDEVHTPDSSRYWRLDSYEERIARGEEPESFDKEFLRLWVRERCDPYKDPIPAIPREMADTLSARYIEMYERITGETFVPGETPIIRRLVRTLGPYAA